MIQVLLILGLLLMAYNLYSGLQLRRLAPRRSYWGAFRATKYIYSVVYSGLSGRGYPGLESYSRYPAVYA